MPRDANQHTSDTGWHRYAMTTIAAGLKIICLEKTQNPVCLASARFKIECATQLYYKYMTSMRGKSFSYLVRALDECLVKWL